MTRKLQPGAENRSRGPDPGAEGRDDLPRQGSKPAFGLARGLPASPLVRGPVHHGHGDAHQRHAVGHRVMAAKDERRAALVVFHDVDRPQRTIWIEGLGRELADELLERLLVAASRQPHASDVMPDVEILVIAPVEAGRRQLHLLAITPVAQQSIGDLLLDPVERDRTLQQPYGHDHHEIGRTVHPQPSRVH